jgi:ABC-type cobalamin/Fe3+-siderophores transport system ATPase subunit
MAGGPADHLDTAADTSSLELLPELYRDTATIAVTTHDLDVTADTTGHVGTWPRGEYRGQRGSRCRAGTASRCSPVPGAP